MDNGMRTGDPPGFTKGRNLKFCVGSRVRQKTEESRGIYLPKRCGNKDEDNSMKPLNDKNIYKMFQTFDMIFNLITWQILV